MKAELTGVTLFRVRLENKSWIFEKSRDGKILLKRYCLTAEHAEAVRKIYVKQFWGKTTYPN